MLLHVVKPPSPVQLGLHSGTFFQWLINEVHGFGTFPNHPPHLQPTYSAPVIRLHTERGGVNTAESSRELLGYLVPGLLPQETAPYPAAQRRKLRTARLQGYWGHRTPPRYLVSGRRSHAGSVKNRTPQQSPLQGTSQVRAKVTLPGKVKGHTRGTKLCIPQKHNTVHPLNLSLPRPRPCLQAKNQTQLSKAQALSPSKYSNTAVNLQMRERIITKVRRNVLILWSSLEQHTYYILEMRHLTD